MTVTIAFLGDTLLGDLYADLLRARGYGYALEGVAPLLARADFTVVNHEGALTPERRALPGINRRERFWLRAEPESAATLAAHGVRIVSLANNHVLDYGLDGLADTIRALDEHGIAHCGAGASQAEARQPAIVTVNGVRIGFLAYVQRYSVYADWLYANDETGGCNRLRASTLQPDLQRLAEGTDLRIVLVHWGRNYRPLTPSQQRWIPQLPAAGADLVIGHHPHIAQAATVVDGCPILYSLGNGPFGTRGGFERYGQPPYGLVALAEVTDAGRLSALELHLIDVENRRTSCRPTPVTGESAIAFLRSLTEPAHGWRPRGDALRLDLPHA